MRDWSCLVVDDGSTDETLRVARSVARDERRIRILATPPRGIVAALNCGLSASETPFVARMDADDLMHPRRLEVQVAHLLSEPSCSVVGCHVRFFPRASMSDGLIGYEEWLVSLRGYTDVASDAFVECPLAHPTWCAHRTAFTAFGYQDRGWPEDYDLVLRWLAAGLRLDVLSWPLHFWRDAPSRLSRRSLCYSRERLLSCKAEHLRRGLLRNQRRYVLWGYGRTGRMLARALLALEREPAAIVEVHPGRIGQRILGVPVVPYGYLREHRDLPVVVSVAGPGPRAEIRERMAQLGYRECHDFVVAA